AAFGEGGAKFRLSHSATREQQIKDFTKYMMAIVSNRRINTIYNKADNVYYVTENVYTFLKRNG
ncbi:MAG: hypothetical protein LBF97_03615, partial [Elusimicrobiota bacterium]|nr:hypothetical protein [Elusimicrobiota bacterium]